MVKLSENFTLEEMLWSATAHVKGIKNTMTNPTVITENLRSLCLSVLQPVRNHFGPLTVSSGYSCPELARILGRKPTSQHCTGQAADIVSNRVQNIELAKWIMKNLVFDQLIYECRRRKDGSYYDWVHVSYRADRQNRKEVLNSPPSGGYVKGLPVRLYV